MTSHRAASHLAALAGIERQAGVNAAASAHPDGDAARAAHAWIDILYSRSQRHAERHHAHARRGPVTRLHGTATSS